MIIIKTSFKAKYTGNSTTVDTDGPRVLDSLANYFRNSGLSLSSRYTGMLPIPLLFWPLVRKGELIAQDSTKKVRMTYNATVCLEQRVEVEGENADKIRQDLERIYRKFRFSIE